MPAVPFSEAGFPPVFVRSGRMLMRAAESQLVSVDLDTARTAWESQRGTGSDRKVIWGAADGSRFVTMQPSSRQMHLHGVHAASGREIWSSEVRRTDTHALWAQLLGEHFTSIEQSDGLLQSPDKLVVAMSSHPVLEESMQSGRLTTHLSSGQPLVELARLDPADGHEVWRTPPLRVSRNALLLHDQFVELAHCDGAIVLLDWASGSLRPVAEAETPPETTACCRNTGCAVWRVRGGLRVMVFDLAGGAARVVEHRKRGVRRVCVHSAGGGEFLLEINTRTVALVDNSSEMRWFGRIGSHVYGVIGEAANPVFVDTAGAGAALYAFDRASGDVLIHERSALGAGGDLTRVDGTDLLAVSLSSRNSYAAGGLVVVRTDGSGLRRLDVPHGIVASYRGTVITRAEKDANCWPLSDDILLTAVAER